MWGDSTIDLDPTSARALAHPLRLKILGHLRTKGPATSTMLAAAFGLNTGSTSYHVRQLAAHGFVEEASDQGNRKDRWWRSSHRSTRFSGRATPDSGGEALVRAVAQIHAERILSAAEVHSTQPPEWQDSSSRNDVMLLLDENEAAQLSRELLELIGRYRRHDPEGDVPARQGAVPVSLIWHLFPEGPVIDETDGD